MPDIVAFPEVRAILDQPLVGLAMIAMTKEGVIHDGATVHAAVEDKVIEALELLIEKIKRGECRPRPEDVTQ